MYQLGSDLLLYTVLKLFLHVNCNFSLFHIRNCFKLCFMYLFYSAIGLQINEFYYLLLRWTHERSVEWAYPRSPTPTSTLIPFQISVNRLESDKMSIEHIWEHIGWLWTIVQLSPKPQKSERGSSTICVVVERSSLWRWPCFNVVQTASFSHWAVWVFAARRSGSFYSGICHRIRVGRAGRLEPAK